MEDFFKYAVGEGWLATTILFPQFTLLYAIWTKDTSWQFLSAVWAVINAITAVSRADIRTIIREEKGIR